MTYQIVYGASFRDDVRDHVAWLRRQKVSEGRIEAWYARLFDHIDTLQTWPRRCPLAPDYSDPAPHKLNFDDYLILYDVNETPPRVELLNLVHGSRSPP